MKIKNYKCIACGSPEFYTEVNKNVDNALGLYCSYCGKFYKWLNKDEKNLVKRAGETEESDAEFMCKAMSKTINKSTDDRNFIGGC